MSRMLRSPNSRPPVLSGSVRLVNPTPEGADKPPC